MPYAAVRILPYLALTVLAACAKDAPSDAAADATPAPAVTVLPANVATRTLAEIGDSASRIEGIALHDGKLYVTDWKDGAIYRIDPTDGTPVKVGALPTAPNAAILGLVTDVAGNLYAAMPDSGIIYRVAATRLGAAGFDAAKDVTTFATGAKGANGLTFDAQGHLWISGGDAGALYHVGPDGGAATVFASGYAPVSSDTAMPVRAYVVNGAAIDSKGFIYTANTGSGTITKLEIKPDFTVGAITTLVADARLLGADGLAMGTGDTLWVTANFRNTLAKVAPDGSVSLVARETTAGGALRFPAELKVAGTSIYIANLNFPMGSNAGSAPGATVAAVEVN
jgi:sugar lactone lactonase YvrE